MAINGKSLGIALSGGGYRAALFGLGSLWRLNDLGLLSRLDRVTSVSGGSILAGVLAHRWPRLTFVNGIATNFIQEVAEPVQGFCTHTIDIGAGVAGILTPFKSAGEYLANAYAKHLFGTTTMDDLPVAASGNPKFIFYATNLQTGRSLRFRQDMIADYMLGVCSGEKVPLATAVAASSAFPPFFSPIIVKTNPKNWKEGASVPNIDKLRGRIVLADGGVYDNMGLESLVGNVDIVLVSDAGAPFGIEDKPHTDYVRMLGRVRDILIDQTRALRKRVLVEDFEAGRMRGAYWGIGTRVEDYRDANSAFKDTEVTHALASVPTRLAKFEQEICGRLVNWGYVLCDVAVRMRAHLDAPTITALPIPNARLA
jgi:NTE family protein